MYTEKYTEAKNVHPQNTSTHNIAKTWIITEVLLLNPKIQLPLEVKCGPENILHFESGPENILEDLNVDTVIYCMCETVS